MLLRNIRKEKCNYMVNKFIKLVCNFLVCVCGIFVLVDDIFGWCLYYGRGYF